MPKRRVISKLGPLMVRSVQQVKCRMLRTDGTQLDPLLLEPLTEAYGHQHLVPQRNDTVASTGEPFGERNGIARDRSLSRPRQSQLIIDYKLHGSLPSKAGLLEGLQSYLYRLSHKALESWAVILLPDIARLGR